MPKFMRAFKAPAVFLMTAGLLFEVPTAVYAQGAGGMNQIPIFTSNLWFGPSLNTVSRTIPASTGTFSQTGTLRLGIPTATLGGPPLVAVFPFGPIPVGLPLAGNGIPAYPSFPGNPAGTGVRGFGGGTLAQAQAAAAPAAGGGGPAAGPGPGPGALNPVANRGPVRGRFPPLIGGGGAGGGGGGAGNAFPVRGVTPPIIGAPAGGGGGGGGGGFGGGAGGGGGGGIPIKILFNGGQGGAY